jgi:hypothetical protein
MKTQRKLFLLLSSPNVISTMLPPTFTWKESENVKISTSYVQKIPTVKGIAHIFTVSGQKKNRMSLQYLKPKLQLTSIV